jgi:hypothetical protein
MVHTLKRYLMLVTVGLTVAAVLDQLRRPEEARTWQGRVLGVPYDFRQPTLERFLNAWWNPDEPRLFLPRDFGIGWSINLHHLKTVLLEPARGNGDG